MDRYLYLPVADNALKAFLCATHLDGGLFEKLFVVYMGFKEINVLTWKQF